MVSINKFYLLSIAALYTGLVMAEGPAFPERKADPKTQSIQYILIANTSFKTFNNMNCELVVFKSVNRQRVKIVRIDPPAGTINATYVVDHPETVASKGIDIWLAKEFDLRAHTIQSVRSQIEFDNREKNVVLVVTLDNGERLTKTRSVDAEFFRDHAQQCLK